MSSSASRANVVCKNIFEVTTTNEPVSTNFFSVTTVFLTLFCHMNQAYNNIICNPDLLVQSL